MSQITTIPLNDQVLAVLRARRIASALGWTDSEEISQQLGRAKSEVIPSLNDLYELGWVSRISDSVSTRYRQSPEGERTPGRCICCEAKLIPTDQIFCQTCGPEFSGRV